MLPLVSPIERRTRTHHRISKLVKVFQLQWVRYKLAPVGCGLVQCDARKAGKGAGGQNSKTGGIGCSVRGASNSRCLIVALIFYYPRGLLLPRCSLYPVCLTYTQSHPQCRTHNHVILVYVSFLIHCAAPYPLIVTSNVYCHSPDSVKACIENVN